MVDAAGSAQAGRGGAGVDAAAHAEQLPAAVPAGAGSAAGAGAQAARPVGLPGGDSVRTRPRGRRPPVKACAHSLAAACGPA